MSVSKHKVIGTLMRDWLPFTDYDLWGYLSSGLLLLFCMDFALFNSSLMIRDEWTFVEALLAIGIAYSIGHVVAWPSALIYEQNFFGHVIYRPVDILIGAKEPRKRERFLSIFCVGRYYRALDKSTITAVFERATSDTGAPKEELMKDPEAIFACAHTHAMQNELAVLRINTFQNQYGFHRNVSMACTIGAVIMFSSDYSSDLVSSDFVGAILLAMSIGLFSRFLKFYSTYSADIMKVYAHRH